MQFLAFRDIDLRRDAELCVRFRADSFVCSFGSDTGFHGPDGAGASRYLKVLAERIRDFPGGCVHAYDGNTIAGQLEVRRDCTATNAAYVNLYYLDVPYRGCGRAHELEAYIHTLFRSRGISAATLSVSPTNTTALAVYDRLGWKLIGPRPGTPELLTMKKQYD